MQKKSSFDLMKIFETGQKPDLNKTLKIKFSNSYVLNSNPWLALIPTVGHDSYLLDHHVRIQSIIMERNWKLHTRFGIHDWLDAESMKICKVRSQDLKIFSLPPDY